MTAELLAFSSKRTGLAPETETNLYRIVREALNNTHKYAKAKSVEVMPEKRDNLIVLLVEGDGAGFNVENKMNRLEGLDLIEVKERRALRRHVPNRIRAGKRNDRFRPRSGFTGAKENFR